MIGTEKALINKICETMTTTEGLLEFIDNPLDKNAKNIYVNYDFDENYIKIYNDGLPFSNLEDYLHEFIGTFKHNIGDIGSMSQGSKQAAACILDNKIGIMRIFSPCPEKNYCMYGEIRFNTLNKETSIESKTNILLYDHIDFKTFNNKYGIKKNGVTFILEHLKEETKSNIDKLEKECAKRYGKRNLKNNTNIYIQDKKVIYEDPLYLKVLGDDINNEGFHIKDGIVFLVHTHYFKYKGENRQFKTVLTYITRNKYKTVNDIPDFVKMLNHVGIYTFLGDRLMDCGGNLSTMFGTDFDSFLGNSGGTDRVRMGIFCDGNADIFQISSNKTQGIKNLCLNENLKQNCVSLEKRKLSVPVKDGNNDIKSKKIEKNHFVYDELRNDFYMFEKINRYEASIIDDKLNKIDYDTLNKFYNGITPRKKTITQNKTTIKDYIKNEKDLDCYLINMLEQIKEENVKNVFKSFYLQTRDKINDKKTIEIMSGVLENLKTIQHEEGDKIHRGTEAA